MPREPELSFCAAEARRHDPDRYLCALFSPAARREQLMALIAFNLELARIVDTVTQPMTGYIRLQWWRDAVDGAVSGTPREHPVVRALADALAAGHVPAGDLDAMIDAREPEVEGAPVADLSALEARARATAGQLQQAIAACLGVTDAADLAEAANLGTAWGLAGAVLNVAHDARHGRATLPADAMARAGLATGQLLEPATAPRLATIVEPVLLLAEQALAAVGQARRRQRRAFRPAFLAELLLRPKIRALRAVNGDLAAMAALRRPATAPLRLLLAQLAV